jgi:hypothetical protein
MLLRFNPKTLALAACLCVVALGPQAMAQTSPYYIGVAQTFSHDSNLFRVRDGQLPPNDASQSDTISSTALVAGVDQRFGRQRLSGSASLRTNRYSNNKAFNGQGYSLSLGLDWQTIESLSGDVNFASDRAQRADLRARSGQYIGSSNIETSNRFNTKASLGVAGPLALEAGFSSSTLTYAAEEASYAEYSQVAGFAGLRYRLGGSTSVALTLRQTVVKYPNFLITQLDPRDRRVRRDVDLSGTWAPSGASRVDLRVSRGATHYDQLDSRDFSATSGDVVWIWQPTGRLKFNTRLARDLGQNSDLATTAYSVSTDTLRVAAEYEVSAKIAASLALQHYRRNLDGSGALVVGVTGSDSGDIWSLGLRWVPLRSVSLGCQISGERRGRNSNAALVDAYSSNAFSCNGQLVLQ